MYSHTHTHTYTHTHTEGVSDVLLALDTLFFLLGFSYPDMICGFAPSIIVICYVVFGWYPWEPWTFLKGNIVEVDFGKEVKGELGRTGRRKIQSGSNVGEQKKLKIYLKINYFINSLRMSCSVLWLYLYQLPKSSKPSSITFPLFSPSFKLNFVIFIFFCV